MKMRNEPRKFFRHLRQKCFRLRKALNNLRLCRIIHGIAEQDVFEVSLQLDVFFHLCVRKLPYRFRRCFWGISERKSIRLNRTDAPSTHYNNNACEEIYHLYLQSKHQHAATASLQCSEKEGEAELRQSTDLMFSIGPLIPHGTVFLARLASHAARPLLPSYLFLRGQEELFFSLTHAGARALQTIALSWHFPFLNQTGTELFTS